MRTLKRNCAGSCAKRNLPALMTLGGGVLLTLLLGALVHRLEATDLRHTFQLDAKNYSVALTKSIARNINALHAVEGLYATSPRVTRDRFGTFVKSILPHSAAIHSLRWIPRVPRSQRVQFEAAAVRDGYLGFHIAELSPEKALVPAGRRKEYFPVFFAEPAERNDPALGLDIAAHAAGRAVLDKARDTGAMVASRRITLFLEHGRRHAFLAVQPIYRNALPHDTPSDRRRNLLGFAMGVFRLDDMVTAALSGLNLNGIGLTLTDETVAPERRLLYTNLRPGPARGNALTFVTTLPVADRQWTVTFSATPPYLHAHTTMYAQAVLAAGLVISCLLALYIFKMKRHAAEMEHAKDTTSAVLNSIAAAIAIIDADDMRISACNEVFIRESGCSEREIMGRRCRDVMPHRPVPCASACAECPVGEAARTGEPAIAEYCHRGAEAAVFYLEISAYPEMDCTGSVRHVVSLAQDITARKAAENSRLEEQQVRRMAAERQVVETQLRMLQAQIEPHFLFNTLANVISLVDQEPRSAKQMLQHLTGSLRLALQRTRDESSTLAQEAEMLTDYLGLFRMRMGGRLDFAVDISPDLLALPFPPMLLQPLVENAIKHGIEPKVDGGRVTVKAAKADNRLRIAVSDTGLGFSGFSNDRGVGLQNVRTRLQALYNGCAALVIEENVPCGVVARIEVPL